MQKLDKLELYLLGFPTESSDETPSTAISTLPHIPTPLPPAEPGSCCIVGVDSWERREDIEEAAPKAPLVKDLDSFTEGTGMGSFDSILDDYPHEQGDLFYHPNSLELLPALEPTTPLSIETWREQVSGHIPEPYEDPVEGTHHLVHVRDADVAADQGLGDLADYGYEPPLPTEHFFRLFFTSRGALPLMQPGAFEEDTFLPTFPVFVVSEVSDFLHSRRLVLRSSVEG